jgi:hypothetical protein
MRIQCVESFEFMFVIVSQCDDRLLRCTKITRGSHPHVGPHVHIGCMIEERQNRRKYLQMRTIGPNRACKPDERLYETKMPLHYFFFGVAPPVSLVDSALGRFKFALNLS